MWTRRALLQSLLSAAAASACRPLATEKDWNILLITSDEHNHRLMGCAGHPFVETPALDRLAAEGTRFTAAHAAAPLCAPSRQSLMTGLYPQEHGVVGNAAILSPEHVGLAEPFTRAGWATGLYGKVHTNNPAHHLGFQTFETPDTPEFAAEIRARRLRAKAIPDRADRRLFAAMPDSGMRGQPIAADDTDTGGAVSAGAIRFLEQNRNRRFFLYASYTDPHHPWELPEAWYYRYRPADMPDAPAGPETLSAHARRIYDTNGWAHLSRAQRQLLMARYAGAVSYLDHQVGTLLASLDRLGLADRTLVVYTSDHGEMGGNKGLWLKSVMYQDAIGVPLIVRAPGLVRAGAQSQALFSLTGLLPTLAETVGLGGALPPNVRDRAAPELLVHPDVAGPPHVFAALPTRSGAKGQFMARSQRYKLVSWRDRAETVELYDLEADPHEAHDLAAEGSAQPILDAHRAALEDWRAGLSPNPHEVGRVARVDREITCEDQAFALAMQD